MYDRRDCAYDVRTRSKSAKAEDRNGKLVVQA